MAEVYWIRKESHTDLFSEGYVGVTSRTAQERYQEHVYNAQCRTGKKSIVHKVIIALGKDNLVVETICICEEDYAYDLEAKLRPTERIGWNVSPGGSKPPGVKGLPVSQETRKKLSAAQKGRKVSEEEAERLRALSKMIAERGVSEETRKKMSAGNKGHSRHTEYQKQRVREAAKLRIGEKRSEESRNRQSDSIKAKGYWSTKRANKSVWALCDLFYEDFISGMTKLQIQKKHGLGYGDLTSIFKHFNNGWNPLEDEAWLRDFKDNKQ